MRLSKRLEIPETATGKVHDRALLRKQANLAVYNFSAGDPKISLHPLIEKEMEVRLSQAGRIVSYPPISGMTELRKGAAEWMKKRTEASYSIEETLVTNGGKFAIYALLMALINSGDEVLVLAPYWVSYLPILQLCGGRANIVETHERRSWKVETDDLEAKCSPKTKLLILNNGCNPTGALYREEEIEKILKWAKKRDLFVLSDEVYSEIVYDGNKFVSCALFPEYRERVAIVESCSKNFCMTGFRVGFTFGPKVLIEALATLQGQSALSASLMSQWAAIGALKNSEIISKGIRKEMQRKRDLFTHAFNSHFATDLSLPLSGIYQFVSLETMGIKSDSKSFCERAIEKKGLALIPGTAFGREGYVRFSFSEKDEEILEGIQVLKEFCEEERCQK